MDVLSSRYVHMAAQHNPSNCMFKPKNALAITAGRAWLATNANSEQSSGP